MNTTVCQDSLRTHTHTYTLGNFTRQGRPFSRFHIFTFSRFYAQDKGWDRSGNDYNCFAVNSTYTPADCAVRKHRLFLSSTSYEKRPFAKTGSGHANKRLFEKKGISAGCVRSR